MSCSQFVQPVPDHRTPMDRVQFRTWRRAFDRLLDCAAGEADAATCKAGWLRDVAAMVPAQETALAGSLLDYYIPQVLRAPPDRRDRYCRS